MDEAEFDRICSLDAFPRAADTLLSVPEETFWVIKRQLQHRQFRQALRLHRQDKALRKYAARMASGESMCSIAQSVDLAPCMMARLLLDARFGWSKTTISNVFKEAMQADDTATANRRGLSEEEFARVRQDVKECIDQDVHCSPLADRIRHNMGLEYEYLLLESLRNRQLVFESEDMLREKGLSKTPDVRMLLPIGVKDPKSGQTHVVNWIDSKAMFGDRHTHETENASQVGECFCGLESGDAGADVVAALGCIAAAARVCEPLRPRHGHLLVRPRGAAQHRQRRLHHRFVPERDLAAWRL
jgi:hypothetical protein